MSVIKKYRCVNCGMPCSALYRTYGQSVLKLTKCVSCKGIVDKYIEYDPVIVMIDLVLVSKEAQRHILYNTDFKAYWKLFIILTMLDTYAVWRSDSLFSLAVNTLCDVDNNNMTNSVKLDVPLNFSIPESWINSCDGWIQDTKGDDSDLFIWEKDFYVQFISTFSGIVMFIVTTHWLMKIIQLLSNKSREKEANEQTAHLVPSDYCRPWTPATPEEVQECCRPLRKECNPPPPPVTSASAGTFSLAVLVWGASAHLRLHYALVALYGFVVFGSVFAVVYETPTHLTMMALIFSNMVKCYTTFHMTPYLRTIVT